MHPQKPTLTIIGLGRLGSALFRSALFAGYQVVSVVSAKDLKTKFHNCSKVQHARKIHELSHIGDICFICVPDDAISTVATKLAPVMDLSETYVVHVSGAKVSKELDPVKYISAGTASFHPIQTFTETSKKDVFDSITVTLEGNSEAISLLKSFVLSLNAKPLVLSPEDKSRVHTAAVFTSNFMFSLFLFADDILRQSPTEQLPGTSDLFAALCNQTLGNILEHGMPHAITGPASRGDLKTLNKHLELLESDDLRKVYRLLSYRIAREFHHEDHPVSVFLQHQEQ
jgi:predicted short-subunit dehydrogenase-like oxidoreductase (DUF2520 family)